MEAPPPRSGAAHGGVGAEGTPKTLDKKFMFFDQIWIFLEGFHFGQISGTFLISVTNLTNVLDSINLSIVSNSYKIVHSSTVLYNVLQYATVLYNIVQACTRLYKIVQDCTRLYKIVQDCTMLYKIA